MKPDNQTARLQWSREDLLRLLCVLNFHIRAIRMLIGIEDMDETYLSDQGVTCAQRKTALKRLSEKADVTSVASGFISQQIGNDCSSSRVHSKIRNLWSKHGGTNDQHPKPLYAYGAFLCTLPGLEEKHPGMLEEVASTVRQMQEYVREWDMSEGLTRHRETCQTSPSTTAHPSEQTRRSERLQQKAQPCESVRCRCGFTHHIASVFCKTCCTWQHTYCYYGTEDETKIPDCHRCDVCVATAARDDSLTDDMGQLSITTSNARLYHNRRSLMAPCSNPSSDDRLGPFGLPKDAELFWGPKDSFIHEQLRSCSSILQRFVLPLVHSDADAEGIIQKLQTAPVKLISLIENLQGADYIVTIRHVTTSKRNHKLSLGNMLLGLVTSIIVETSFGDRCQQLDSVETVILQSISRHIMFQSQLIELLDLVQSR